MKYLKALLAGPLLTAIFAAFWHHRDTLEGMDLILYGLFLVSSTAIVFIIPNKV